MMQGQGDEWAARLGGSVGDGRYVLGELLGRGGMAAVHRAHDRRLNRPVAVKTMHAELGRDPEFLRRFEREAETVARINHANVVAVHDSGEQAPPDGGPPVAYMVMEYVAGRSLGEVLRDEAAAGRRIDPDRALAITSDVLAGLAASHELGLVHRDIKPANVMLTDRGAVKVMDFGIARAQHDAALGTAGDPTQLTRTGAIVGTPHYLSPEQAMAQPLDGRSDLYSVGVMLFQLLSGRVPFDGDSFTAIAVKHVTHPPPLLVEFGVVVPPEVQALLSRALEKDPGQRFATAEEMRDAVNRVRGAAAAPLASSPPTPPTVHESPVRPTPNGWGAPAAAPAGAARGGSGGFGPPPVPRPTRAAAATAVLAVTVFLAFGQGFAVSALKLYLMRDFGLSVSQWSTATAPAFTVAYVLGLLAFAAVRRPAARRTVAVCGAFTAMAASFGEALAQDVTPLIAYRAVQGLATAALVAGGLGWVFARIAPARRTAVASAVPAAALAAVVLAPVMHSLVYEIGFTWRLFLMVEALLLLVGAVVLTVVLVRDRAPAPPAAPGPPPRPALALFLVLSAVPAGIMLLVSMYA